MRGLISDSTAEPVNPYIALADSTLNLVLVLVLFIATVLLAILQKEDTHKTSQATFVQAVEAMPRALRPTGLDYAERNDPPGTQRWTFENHLLFKKGTDVLTPEGRRVLKAFIAVLARHGDVWRRVRIEGHTVRTANRQGDDWALATNRAAAVARLLTSGSCKINARYIATAGRGGQARLRDYPDLDARQERVEIILEYSGQTAEPRKCS